MQICCWFGLTVLGTCKGPLRDQMLLRLLSLLAHRCTSLWNLLSAKLLLGPFRQNPHTGHLVTLSVDQVPLLHHTRWCPDRSPSPVPGCRLVKPSHPLTTCPRLQSRSLTCAPSGKWQWTLYLSPWPKSSLHCHPQQGALDVAFSNVWRASGLQRAADPVLDTQQSLPPENCWCQTETPVTEAALGPTGDTPPGWLLKGGWLSWSELSS